MAEYVEREAVLKIIADNCPHDKGGYNTEEEMGAGAACYYIRKDVEKIHTADVIPKSEVAELLRLMFNDDCACNYNGNDEWLPEKCKFALTDCPMPQERLGCWMEFVEYGLAELKKKYTEGEPNGSK